MAEQKETKNPVQSAERIFQVMEMLADHGEMGLMEISTALGTSQKHGTSPSDVFSLYGICKTGRGIPEVYAFL